MAHVAGIWWIITGALLVAELVTGTFYLLMVALGFAAGAIALHFGVGNGWQFVVAAAVAGFALLALHLKRRRGGSLNRNTRGGARFDRDVNMDIGQQIYVEAWHDSRARTAYRGAQWDVQLAPGEMAAPGWYQIIEVRGIQLVVIASTSSVAGDSNA